MERISRLVDSRWTVLVAAVVTVLLRLPGMGRPIRPDEAGFLLVARSWDPSPDSVYGRYFVDRPPILIAFFRLGDLLGGILTIRIIGALGCALTVVLAAEVGRQVAHRAAGRWAAVATAAIITNPLVDPVAVKGEVLALPLVTASILCALLAMDHGSARWAALGGLLAMTAIGFKQNLAGGLVFGGVLLLAAWATHRLTRRELLPLAAAAVAGAVVPVVGTLFWAWDEGVRLPTLAYAVLGFRTDASRVLSTAGSTSAPTERALLLVAVAIGVGMVLIFAGFLIHIRDEWRDAPAVTLATVALLLVDVTFLVAGGSFWLDYLYALVPCAALVVALLSRRTTRRGARMRVVVALSTVSAALSLVVWFGQGALHLIGYTEFETGVAVGAAASPGDTLTVFGGRADLQYASGMASPYAQLWSLPMRTLDPDYTDLQALLDSPRAPTWFVPWVSFGAWGNPAGAALEKTVSERYVVHGEGCDQRRVFLLRGLDRPPIVPHCS